LSLAFLPGVAVGLASVTVQPSAAYLADLQLRANPQAAYSAVWALRHQSVSTFLDVLWRSRAASLPEDTAIWLGLSCDDRRRQDRDRPSRPVVWASTAYLAHVTFVILFSGRLDASVMSS
jgi:hypothetical protein